ncbi:MAG: hypothetical protein Q4C76_00300 [Bacillota bacterium]|nr:hypothetical protein [Bacillota bacterium]
MPTTETYQLRVTLFGPVALENQNARVVENPSRQSKPWLLLKYLLVNRHRPVTREELDALWPQGAGDSAARVRLNRLREALAPLGLDGKSGLVQYSAGVYRLNPRCALDVDEDRLTGLLERLRNCGFRDPAGLQLCMGALTLLVGPFLDQTAAPWVTPYRAHYRKEFCALARETLARSRVLEDDRAASLLLQRAAVMAPEDGELNRDIRAFLEENNRSADLLRCPAPARPKRRADKHHEIVKKIIIEDDKVFFISAASDRRPLCYARWEVLPLTRVYQSDGLPGLLLAVGREIHRGTLRTRADSKLTRAVRKALHTLGLETFLDMEEDPAAQMLADLTLEALRGE